MSFKSYLLAAVVSAVLLPCTLLSQTVRFRTNLGDIDVALLPDSAPQTVANFLKYTNRGAYNNSIFHRSVPGFIIQGGGYQVQGQSVAEIPSDPPVRNEYKVSNTRGTIAMAKLGSDPNSATNQWFFNLSNTNASNLNAQNGGFTVFGRVTDNAGLAVMDKIAALTVVNAGSPFDQLPVMNYRAGQPVVPANLAIVNSITTLEIVPTIKTNGIISASTFGGSTSAAPGTYIEIYGTNLAGTTRQWAGSDFNNGNAPTALDEVSVTVGGERAFINYISPEQVNVQVPANVTTGETVPVVLTYKGQASAPVTLMVKPIAAGLLATPTFNVGGKQYVVAVHASGGSLVTGGNIPNLSAAPAIPGETLTLYGIGFGPVTPSSTMIAGQIAAGTTTLMTSVQITIGSSPAETAYAGLAPGLVGVYQFNVVVPANAASGDQPLKMIVAGETLSQTLYVPVR